MTVLVSNAELAKQSVRKLIKDLLDAVPVPPTTTTAGKARAWFGAGSGLQPTAVKVWMRQNLTQDSLYSGGTVALTTSNAITYCENVDEEIDTFMSGTAPTESPNAEAHAWLNSAGAIDLDDDFLNWFDEQVIAFVIVEI